MKPQQNEAPEKREPIPLPTADNPDRRLTVAQQADNEALSNYRLSSSVAGLCKQLATKTAVKISGKNYVPAATMEAVAIAHGYIVSTNPVEWVPATEHTVGGFRCVAELKHVETGKILSTADGFVGTDEMVWFGGEKNIWKNNRQEKKTYEKRPDFAIRAMCTTRAAGRVCKLAFAHVLVMMDADLETTPAEDVIDAEFVAEATARTVEYTGEPVTDWRNVFIHLAWSAKHGPGCDKDHPHGKQLGELSTAALDWFQQKFEPDVNAPKDLRLRRALDISMGKIQPDQAAAGQPPVQNGDAPD